MARGGAREGAGRRAGSKNKRTLAAEALREQILEAGKSPLEVMVDGMRTALERAEQVAGQVEAFEVAPDADADRIKALTALHSEARHYLVAAHGCAVDAAPYLHPKLSSVEVKNPEGETFEIGGVNNLELARRVAQILTTAAPKDAEDKA